MIGTFLLIITEPPDVASSRGKEHEEKAITQFQVAN
jgi:hypothetical protein